MDYETMGKITFYTQLFLEVADNKRNNMSTKLTITLDQSTADYLEQFDNGDLFSGALTKNVPDPSDSSTWPGDFGSFYSVDMSVASPRLIEELRNKDAFENTDTFVNPWESLKTGVKAVWSHYADPWTEGDTYERFDSFSEIAHYVTGASKSSASAV